MSRLFIPATHPPPHPPQASVTNLQERLAQADAGAAASARATLREVAASLGTADGEASLEAIKVGRLAWAGQRGEGWGAVGRLLPLPPGRQAHRGEAAGAAAANRRHSCSPCSVKQAMAQQRAEDLATAQREAAGAKVRLPLSGRGAGTRVEAGVLHREPECLGDELHQSQLCCPARGGEGLYCGRCRACCICRGHLLFGLALPPLPLHLRPTDKTPGLSQAARAQQVAAPPRLRFQN